MRESNINRKTKETNIEVGINLDGRGKYNIDTPITFFNHMLSTFSKHSKIDLNIIAKGDSIHHIIEDTAITLANAFEKALGDKRGIERFGEAIIPMDDTLVRVVLDIGGRSHYHFEGEFKRIDIDDLLVEDLLHFLETLTQNLKINLHVKILYGKNDHHKIEAVFKALALSFRRAINQTNNKDIPSTKGVL